jgi:hypothetical protein
VSETALPSVARQRHHNLLRLRAEAVEARAELDALRAAVETHREVTLRTGKTRVRRADEVLWARLPASDEEEQT